MTVPERLAALRSLMKEHGVDAYLVPTDDFHCSEYVGEYFKARRFLTGFTGSAGTAVVTQNTAGLWTDGRYFIQAAKQLEGSTITLYKMGEEGVPTIEEFLLDTLQAGQCLGFDGRTMTARQGENLEKKLAEKQVSISCQLDLVGEIWADRPELSKRPVWELEVKYAGKPRNEKFREIRKAMAERGADYFVLTSLDDIAWLLNLRGDDINCNPVFLSYLAMTQSQVLLFAQTEAFSEELVHTLKLDGVELQPYNEIYTYITKLTAGKTVLLDSASANYTLKKSVPASVAVLDETNPTLLPKAMKNSVEIANLRKAHIKDGIAVTRFMRWIKEHIGKEEITELSASETLESFRKAGEHYIGPSFDPIVSYGTHAAIVHYSATPETDIPLQPKGLLLTDTGGQYLEGTTDITRTLVLGPITEKEKTFFTRVLRGNLNLANAKFLHGCVGKSLDYLAREPLWEVGEDYNHGTGHGVGFLLNVHEGPNSFRWKDRPGARPDAVFEEGMVTTDEPGFYVEGEFGIRHENMMVCKKAEKTYAGQFMEFETITLVPFDLDGIDPALMSERELERLNRYHAMVYEKLAPHMNAEEQEWLRHATRAIAK